MSQHISRRTFVSLSALAGSGMLLPRALFAGNQSTQTAIIEIDTQQATGTLSPDLYGQFIEHLGRAINGGIFEENSSSSDSLGFRTDVLEKVQQLHTPLMRYPGGTVTKIYHWKDSIGPLSERHTRPNLIWGGTINSHFGTDEFMKYCSQIKASPYLATNMSTGTAEEAADWVEYCNGTKETYYAQLRKKNGHAEPYGVQYWGIGNEESAEPDAGRLQDVKAYVKEAWQYAKLMKLQDPSIKFVLCGADEKWNEYLLQEMHPVCDYISLHYYVNTEKDAPQSLFGKVDGLSDAIQTLHRQIKTLTPEKVENFSKWYRFPPRSSPVKIAVDELGIWEPEGSGAYNLENVYNWNHALGTATFYNILQRHCDAVGMATWAQTVNVLAPILTNKTTSVCQTIYFPMQFYREHSGDTSLKHTVTCGNLSLPGAENNKVLDVSVTRHDNDGAVTVFVVNRHPSQEVQTKLHFSGQNSFRSATAYELNAPDISSQNTIDNPNKNVVIKTTKPLAADQRRYTFPAHSITALRFAEHEK